MDETAEENVRAQAIQLMGTLPFAQANQNLFALLSVQQPQSVQLAALQSLKKYSEPEMATMLLQRWPTLTPRLRSEAIAALLARPDRALALLQSIDKRAVQPSELNSTQVKFLNQHKDPKVQAEAHRLLVTRQTTGRQEIVNSYQPAISVKGSAPAGKVVYEQRCASCHRAGKQGNAVGPDLVTIKNSGREKLLINILDPNREVPANYLTYLVETKGGESIMGILARENNASVTLRQAFGKEDTVPRSSILNLKNQGQSLMPEGLELVWISKAWRIFWSLSKRWTLRPDQSASGARQHPAPFSVLPNNLQAASAALRQRMPKLQSQGARVRVAFGLVGYTDLAPRQVMHHHHGVLTDITRLHIRQG